MNYPIQIQDEAQLNRLIKVIALEVSETTAEQVLMKFGKISPFMKKAECIRASSEAKVLKGIRNGELKFTSDGKNWKILRSEFNKWNTKNKFL